MRRKEHMSKESRQLLYPHRSLALGFAAGNDQPNDNANHGKNGEEQQDHLVVLPAKVQLCLTRRLAKHICLRTHLLGLDRYLTGVKHAIDQHLDSDKCVARKGES